VKVIFLRFANALFFSFSPRIAAEWLALFLYPSVVVAPKTNVAFVEAPAFFLFGFFLIVEFAFYLV